MQAFFLCKSCRFLLFYFIANGQTTLGRIYVYGWIVQCQGTLTPKQFHLLPAVSPVPPGREVWYGCVQTKRDISRAVEDRG